MKQQNNQIETSSFFVLRRPKLSVNRLLEWQGSESELRAHLANWLDDTEVQEAIYLASPATYAMLGEWRKAPDSKKGQKLETTLTKYFIRMCSRSTPFGTFAGLATGEIGKENSFSLSGDKTSRKSRLDMLIPFLLKQKTAGIDFGLDVVRLKANPSIFMGKEQFRYIGRQTQAVRQIYSLESVQADDYLWCVVEACQQSTPVRELENSLMALDADIRREDALAYLQELVAADLLEVELPLHISNAGNLEGFVTQLKQYDLGPIAATLEACEAKLADIDSDLGQDVEKYQAIKQLLADENIEANQDTCVQTDIWFNEKGLSLSEKFVARLNQDLMQLLAMSSGSRNNLDEFKARFCERYEGHVVPLLQALDEESGIGFSLQKNINTPILDYVAFNAGGSVATTKWTEFDQYVFSKVMQSPCADEVVLSLKDYLPAEQRQGERVQVPASFKLSGSVLGDDNNIQSTYFDFQGCGGPSAANMLGRFCHLNAELNEAVLKELEFEQSMYPDAILAEIIHFPEGRIGNVVARPTLRAYEIPLLSDAYVSNEKQIQLQDLQVFVQNNKVVLWSTKHNKEVIPRLSTAHNTRDNSLGLYSFLASLQFQNARLPAFSLSEPLSALPYVPRIKLGRLILSPRRWQVPVEAMLKLANELTCATVARFREEFRLPQVVVFKEYDQKLTIDLNNKLAVRALVNCVKKQMAKTDHMTRVLLEESLQLELGSPVRREQESYFHEVLLPMRNKGFRFQPSSLPARMSTSQYQTKFLPGDSWTCCKIYCGVIAAEQLLTQVVMPWLAKESENIENVFFLRYADPEFHIRLRVQAATPAKAAELQLGINRILHRAYETQMVSDVTWIAYTRETERYGGPEGMLLSEKIFTADSQCILELLSLELEDNDLWQVALLACDRLLNDLSFDLDAKIKILRFLRAGYGQEFNENTQLRRSLGDKYRQYEQAIAQTLTQTREYDNAQQVAEALSKRSNRIAALGQSLTQLASAGSLSITPEDIASSYLHMCTNRLLKGDGRKQELCLYDFLLKVYMRQRHTN